MRIRRLAEDRVASVAAPLRRRRCVDPACGWEGVVAVAPDAARKRRLRERMRKRAQRPRRVAIGVSLTVGLVFALTVAQAWQLYQRALPDPVIERIAARQPLVPFGQSHEGEPLPGDHPLLARVTAQALPASAVPASVPITASITVPSGAPTALPTALRTALRTDTPSAVPAARDASSAGGDALTLRQNCAWGDPGRDPYRGTVEQALEGARLPPEIAARLARMIKAGQATDRLEITNASIRTVHQYREYDPSSIAMTFGKTLCLNTRVNFRPGHLERADLYEVADASGATYSVMVPYGCGNVSVLGDRAERADERAVAPIMVLGPDGRPVLRKASAPLPGVIAGNIGRPTVQGRGGEGGTPRKVEGQVPEPGTLANLLGGVAWLGWLMRRRARKPGCR